MAKGRIAVGLSGGVDSSVAAWLLKQQGHDLLGLFMVNWRETTGTLSGDCPWEDDIIFAQLVARRLGIPFEVVDLSEQYRHRVVDYMFAEYSRGRTPNPDVLCNREIKFDMFVQAAFDRGATGIATGHYCRRGTIAVGNNEVYQLLAGIDSGKDQSYFLCQLSQKQLSTAIFPVGRLMKSEVRRIAEENGLATARRKDSQGICFVGKVDLPVFLQQQLAAKDGTIVEIPADFAGFRPAEMSGNRHEQLQALAAPYKYSPADGKPAGTHRGAQFFTIGQRKGLNVGGKAEPLFVIATDVESNTLYVGQGEHHPGLYRSALFIAAADVHWVREDLRMCIGSTRPMLVRVRYRQPLQHAVLHCMETGIYIVFSSPQRGIAPGQFAAWYDADELLGSGVIQ